jgi:PAS domain S-box-containing protein
VKSAGPRTNEAESIAALRDLAVLDTASEAEFQALVEVASAVCGVPISLISLIDVDRQWFKASVGLPGVESTSRATAFCAHAVLSDEILEVPDAREDDRFADNPLVTGRPDIRFYAGAPLVLRDGLRVGTVCVIDRVPRRLTDMQRNALRQLAVAAGRALEGRAAAFKVGEYSRELLQRKHTLRLVLDAVPSMMAYWDTKLHCRFANKAYETWFGVEPDKLIGTHIRHLLKADLYARNLPFLQAALRGEPQQFERLIAGPDGVNRHSLAFYVPDIIDGKVQGILVQVTDITSLKQTEQALRQEAEELQRVNALLQQTGQALSEAQRLGHIGSWELDLADGTTTWSDEMYRITGHDPSRPPPPLDERIQSLRPASRAQYQRAVDRCVQQGEPYGLELEYVRHSDRKVIWIDARGAAVLDNTGRAIALRGTAQDITERKQNELALRTSQEFLERTGSIAGVGGWEVDLPSGEINWSAAVCRIHGLEPGYRPTFDEAIAFYEPSSRPIIQAAVQRAIETGAGFDLELEIMRTDGAVRGVRTVGAVDIVDGAAVRLLGALQDVTERRRLEATQAALRREEQLRQQLEDQAAKLKTLLHERTEMLDVLAHEVRQPLNNASAALQSAQGALRGREDAFASDRLVRARAVLGEVLTGIDNTLAVAALLARPEPIQQADTDIDMLLAVVTADMPESERGRIKVCRDTTTRTVLMDMSLMRLALRNAVSNALKFSPPDSDVRVRIADSDDPLALVIDVSDSGAGIAPEVLTSLFTRGGRGRNANAGHGLGLYIVRQVMSLHGGSVDVVSTGPDGTTLRLVLDQTEADN